MNLSNEEKNDSNPKSRISDPKNQYYKKCLTMTRKSSEIQEHGGYFSQ